MRLSTDWEVPDQCLLQRSGNTGGCDRSDLSGGAATKRLGIRGKRRENGICPPAHRLH